MEAMESLPRVSRANNELKNAGACSFDAVIPRLKVKAKH